MKVTDFRDIWKQDIAVSGISVIRQTPVWNTVNPKPRQMNGFLLIDTGELFYRWEGGEAAVAHGDLIYLPEGSVHRGDRNGSALSYYRVNFTLTDSSDGERTVFSRCPAVMMKKAGSHMFSLCGRMAESCLSNRSFLTLSLFGEFMDSLMQATGGTGSSRISHAVDYISAHYTEESNLEKLAGECCLSKAQFFRLFRQATGTAPLEYRNRLRIEKAQQLIDEGDCGMGEIAGLLGFGSVYYFSRVFKSVTGLSPTQYAKSGKKG